MRLIYHPDAEAELIAAAAFYERRVATLGARFLDAVDYAIGVIQGDPERGRIVQADVRRHLLSRYPYTIYYRFLEDEIRVLAVKHHSRHPNYWRYRLAD